MVEAGRAAPHSLSSTSELCSSPLALLKTSNNNKPRFEDPLARRPSETLGAGGAACIALSSPTSSLKLPPSLLSFPSSATSASSGGIASPRGESPRHAAPDSPSTSLFARLLRKKSEKMAGADSGGSWVEDDLGLPMRRHHSFNYSMRADASAGSFRRSVPVLGVGAAAAAPGPEGGLQGQTREALQQLLRHKSHGGDDSGPRAMASTAGSVSSPLHSLQPPQQQPSNTCSSALLIGGRSNDC